MEILQSLQHMGERLEQGPTLAFLILIVSLILGPKVAGGFRLPAMVGLVIAGMAVGPHGLRILDSQRIALSAIGQFGLLYLMFSAGLELDFKRLARMKKAAITFALLSFAIPFTFGIASARLLHYAWAAAVLMGSNWGSHTLVTYPLLRQMGLARNPAVGTVVGATAITDTSALLVLAGVSASVSKTSSLGVEGMEILLGLVLLGLFTLVALPRIARWFFARVGTDRSYRFVFSLAAFLCGAVLAEAASIDGIVGAFFAGLGLNRAIPERSPLMEHVQFFGASLFIPIFLVSVGVLLEPRVMIDPKTLVVALVFTIAVLGGKALAAILAGRASKFTWPEIGVMSGLSGSQAAATLATTLVGARLGLFDTVTINAVLVVILASLVVTPALVTFFGKKISGSPADEAAIGSAVLVPIYSEATRPLLAVAGHLAEGDAGVVIPWCFATEDAPEAEIAAQRNLKDKAEEWLAKEGLESHSLFRVSRSLEAGLLQTVRAEKASLLLGEWHFEGLDPDSEAAGMIARSPVSILLVRGALEPFDRLLVMARPQDLVRPGSLDLELAAQLAERLARGRKVGYVGTSPDALASLFTAKTSPEPIESADAIAWAADHIADGDLMVFAGIDAAREALRRLPGLDQRRFLVAIAARTTQAQPQEAPSGRVVGRTMTELPST